MRRRGFARTPARACLGRTGREQAASHTPPARLPRFAMAFLRCNHSRTNVACSQRKPLSDGRGAIHA
ncbi:hypothetical protein WM03_01320 [Burkholderia ubonensis]|uniref:Uncharacterized protein n=2 Tax=Burkholderia cepacia complex TaxID=87882 RepID=A0A1B4Q1P9_BURCE|nr:hypothetical protein WT26_30380 [Burkholderia cepacia]AOK26875.1 hypothetical protein WK67_30235 [Burkholderia ubonensis]KVN63668.1 hypothetical protein WJ65_18170 [Burkholderia ubonensis]KVN71107.1 hypothetical protein WJ67_24215 [Burkholderia ubonensis]KVQ90631.1 hypothetical protein WK10_28605 [Burkholderia ubonensis]